MDKDKEELAMYGCEDNPMDNNVYQGFNMINSFLLQLEADSKKLDPAIDDLIFHKFNPRSLRKMSNETAIQALEVLEKAKRSRVQTYLDFTSRLLSEDFYRRQLELEKQKVLNNIEAEGDKEKPLVRKDEKRVLRLLQDAVQRQLDLGGNE